MGKDSYYYNTSTLRYEKIEVSWKLRMLKLFGFLCAALVCAFLIVVISFKYIESPTEKALKRDLEDINLFVGQLEKNNGRNQKILEELQSRDDNIYRVIFEAEPIPSTIRDVGVGGSQKYKQMDNLPNSDLLTSVAGQLDKIERQIYVQSKSYDMITDLVENREEFNACRPAIQPVNNKDLTRVASGYGMRIHPIYKTRKMHYGMDFTAPTGADVYSTGKGKIYKVQKSSRGYGYNIIVDHGFGFRTRYAHLSEILVTKGQKVNRGDVIGKVGNTGLSTAPHLHYEVIKMETNKKGKAVEKRVDPVYYFYNDLSPEEYEQMIELSSKVSQSFD